MRTRGIRIVGILIAIGLFLTPHALLLETLLVHFVGPGNIVVIVLIERIVIVPPVPQPRIIVDRAPPWISVPSPTPKTVAGIAKAESAKADPARASSKGRMRGGSGAHTRREVSTAGCPTRVRAEATGTASAETGMATEATAADSATLSPERHGDEKSERRDGDQATHRPIV